MKNLMQNNTLKNTRNNYEANNPINPIPINLPKYPNSKLIIYSFKQSEKTMFIS